MPAETTSEEEKNIYIYMAELTWTRIAEEDDDDEVTKRILNTLTESANNKYYAYS